MSVPWNWRELDPLIPHEGETMCLVNKEANVCSNGDYWTWHRNLIEVVKLNVPSLNDRYGQSLLDLRDNGSSEVALNWEILFHM